MGWTEGAVRRNMEFLRSVDPEQLRGMIGFAFTGTILERPESAEALAYAVKRFCQASKAVHFHWVIEMQPRKGHRDGPCPHLHFILYYHPATLPSFKLGKIKAFGPQALILLWLSLTNKWGSQGPGQYCREVDNHKGWAQYLGKHSARSVAHYQRTAAMPKGWSKMGRVWGASRNWPRYTEQFQVSDKVFYALRRATNAYARSQVVTELRAAESRLANAGGTRQRQAAERQIASLLNRLVYLRGQLQRKEEKNARVVPISEWMDSGTIRNWLRKTCETIDYFTPESEETGEVFTRYVMPGEVLPESLGWQAFSLAQAALHWPEYSADAEAFQVLND